MDMIPYEIAETAHLFRRSFDQRAAALGVTRAQWRVMFILERQPGLRQVDLADRLDIEPITLCRHIDRLEEAGLVERRPDPADRRAWKLYLTEVARPLAQKLDTLGSVLVEEAFAGLEPAQLEAVRALLKKVRGNLIELDHRAKAANE